MGFSDVTHTQEPFQRNGIRLYTLYKLHSSRPGGSAAEADHAWALLLLVAPNLLQLRRRCRRQRQHHLSPLLSVILCCHPRQQIHTNKRQIKSSLLRRHGAQPPSPGLNPEMSQRYGNSGTLHFKTAEAKRKQARLPPITRSLPYQTAFTSGREKVKSRTHPQLVALNIKGSGCCSGCDATSRRILRSRAREHRQEGVEGDQGKEEVSAKVGFCRGYNSDASSIGTESPAWCK